MNTEAIIEKLLSIEEGQILNTPLDELDLPIRVHRSLRRARVRTVGDVAQAWEHILQVRNFGEGARGEILGALEAWSRSIPDFDSLPGSFDTAERDGAFQTASAASEETEPQAEADAPGCEPDLSTPIEALHLSQRTYRLLRRNHIDTLADVCQDPYRIASLRNVGRGTRDEIQKALEAMLPSEKRPSGSVGSFVDLAGTNRTWKPTRLSGERTPPPPGSRPAKYELADLPAADGYETLSEIPIEALDLPGQVFHALEQNDLRTVGANCPNVAQNGLASRYRAGDPGAGPQRARAPAERHPFCTGSRRAPGRGVAGRRPVRHNGLWTEAAGAHLCSPGKPQNLYDRSDHLDKSRAAPAERGSGCRSHPGHSTGHPCLARPGSRAWRSLLSPDGRGSHPGPACGTGF